MNYDPCVIAHWLAWLDQQLPDVDCYMLEQQLGFYVCEAEMEGFYDLDRYLAERLAGYVESMRSRPPRRKQR